ncbi:MAG: YesL family protein [Kineothrix sp.]|nr:YesL family protein [Kineothrix sp.]
MGRIFDMDSPVMRFLGRVADLMILNLVTLLCCLPVVTIGASLTAMHYVLLKMVRNEDSYIIRSFFKSFKENFKQATVIWLIMLVFLIVFGADIMIINHSGMEFPSALKIILFALAMIGYMVMCYVFPVLCRFENTIRKTIKNALFMAILSFPKTIVMMVLYVSPIILIYFFTMAVPLVILFGISAPAYLSAMLYSGTFKKFEPEEEPYHDRFESGEGIDMDDGITIGNGITSGSEIAAGGENSREKESAASQN